MKCLMITDARSKHEDRVVVIYRRFEKNYRCRLQGSFSARWNYWASLYAELWM